MTTIAKKLRALKWPSPTPNQAAANQAADALDAAREALEAVQKTIKAKGPISYEDRIFLFAPVDDAIAKLRDEEKTETA